MVESGRGKVEDGKVKDILTQNPHSTFCHPLTGYRPVALTDRAPDSKSGGWGVKSPPALPYLEGGR